MDVGTISAIEQRDSRRSQFGVALAKALGLSLEQLLDEATDYLPSLLSGSTLPQATIQTHPAALPIAPWPFKTVTPNEWRGLGEPGHSMVEAYIRGLVDSNRSPRKSRKTGTTD